MATHVSGPAKCPCCSNPWSRATGDHFAQMCGECQTKQEPEFGLSRSNMDESFDPKENFYMYSNGGWMNKNPIPAGYPSWDTFTVLHVQSQERCKKLLEDDLQTKAELNCEEHKLTAFYKAAMDEESIEKAGAAPLEPLLHLIEDIVASKDDRVEYAQLLGSMPKKFGIYPFFSTGPSPDAKNSDHTLCDFSQGGIGLPDRDYYFDQDKKSVSDAYRKHVAMMLTLLEDAGATEPTATAILAAEKVYMLEERLAEKHMTRTENRDPEETYNKFSIELLKETCENLFDFESYLLGSTDKSAEELGDVNVRNVSAIRRVADVISSVEADTLGNYLKWHAVSSCAPYLSKAFVNENFNFYEKILSGTTELKPRWKRAMAFTETALGEALGQIYCSTYFDEDCKLRAVAIVESVRQALEDRLKEVEWMTSDSTREEALKKMSKFRVKIGYPSKWIDYSSLEISEGEEFMSMVFKARSFAHRRETKEMNAPTDREKWFMTPQTVNAYYHPSLNEIVFPAAILQHPFFDKNADDAVNYGSMGAVVGHEMTHAFDDEGRKFNWKGELNDWWTSDDAAEYQKRVTVMVEQANSFEVHGKNVQGKLTSGENIADLGGLRLSLRALQTQESFKAGKKIDGFTPSQRFFLAWSQCWRENITKEQSLQLLTIDPHGPNPMRCNGPLSNMPEFHEAFAVPEGAPMHKAKNFRVSIW